VLQLWLVLQWRKHLRQLGSSLQHPAGLSAAVWLLQWQCSQPQPFTHASQPITTVGGCWLLLTAAPF
jgi:hypothetical protein